MIRHALPERRSHVPIAPAPDSMPGRWWRSPAAGVLLAALAATAPTGSAAELVIPGSGNPEFVLRQLGDAYNRSQPVVRVQIPSSTGTAGALRDVEGGTAALGRVGRPLKPDEQARGLSYLPLGKDPVVFVTGAGVTARSATSAQMHDIYAGRIRDWRELGGNPGPIRAIGREPGDASRGVVNRHLPAFEKITFGNEIKVVHLDPHVIMLLDRFPTSLAFINRSATRAATSKLRILALDGVEPTLANVESGKYPLVLEFGIVHRTRALPGPARGFVAWLQTDEARALLQAEGVSPVPPQAVAAVR